MSHRPLKKATQFDKIQFHYIPLRRHCVWLASEFKKIKGEETLQIHFNNSLERLGNRPKLALEKFRIFLIQSITNF